MRMGGLIGFHHCTINPLPRSSQLQNFFFLLSSPHGVGQRVRRGFEQRIDAQRAPLPAQYATHTPNVIGFVTGSSKPASRIIAHNLSGGRNVSTERGR
jgi:hypothetical protein